MNDKSQLTNPSEAIYRDKDGRVILNSSSPKLIGHEYNLFLAWETNASTVFRFQNGDPAKVGVNGVTNESMIELLIHRITILNKETPSPHNTDALKYLRRSLNALKRRPPVASHDTK